MKLTLIRKGKVRLWVKGCAKACMALSNSGQPQDVSQRDVLSLFNAHGIHVPCWI